MADHRDPRFQHLTFELAEHLLTRPDFAAFCYVWRDSGQRFSALGWREARDYATANNLPPPSSDRDNDGSYLPPDSP